jgi:hypothetical protein
MRSMPEIQPQVGRSGKHGGTTEPLVSILPPSPRAAALEGPRFFEERRPSGRRFGADSDAVRHRTRMRPARFGVAEPTADQGELSVARSATDPVSAFEVEESLSTAGYGRPTSPCSDRRSSKRSAASRWAAFFDGASAGSPSSRDPSRTLAQATTTKMG